MSVSIRSVVLVEEDEAVRAAMAFALGCQRIAVATAGDAAEGMRRVLDRDPDAAIVDLQLRGGSGYDFALWLRRHRPQMPLVMVSTDFRDADSAPPRRAPRRWVTLLAKPFSVSELLAAIRTAARSGDGPGG